MPATRGRPRDTEAHERILAAAYDLFRLHGARAVGVDAIVQRSGVSKMTLYRHFKSKERLVAAFMHRREQLWSLDWLKAEIHRRADDPAERLLAIFDAFDSWFRTAGFDGCSFINILLEHPPGHPTHRAASQHLANIRGILIPLARQAGIKDPKTFADVWHVMMKGSIVTSCEGNRSAARQIKAVARLYLDSQLPPAKPAARKRPH
ncbi:MAG: TetR/AcrR family transcriptional regulator [Hyphomonadaceae bacterium]|nr:TetR/AcrR family transcriptional regulator [Hyphomonadaceae bacterium]